MYDALTSLLMLAYMHISFPSLSKISGIFNISEHIYTCMFHHYEMGVVGFEFRNRAFNYHQNSQCRISDENWVYMCGKFIKQDLPGNMTHLEVQVSFFKL